MSHKDGKIHIFWIWKAWSAPELTSISTVTVVGGQKTSVLLKGRNFTVPGTKINCTYMGKCMPKEILCSTYPGTIYMMTLASRGLTSQEDLLRDLVDVSLRWKIVSKGTTLLSLLPMLAFP